MTYRPSSEDFQGAAAVRNFGESLQAAVEREIKEETSLLVKAEQPLSLAEIKQTDSDSPYHYVVIDLLCQYLSGQVNADSDALRAEWFARNKVMQLDLQTHTREFIQRWWLNGERGFLMI